MRMMNVLGISPWDIEISLNNLVPVCQKTGATDAAIMVMCHPENLPLEQKMTEFLCYFSNAKKLLKAAGINAGILMQTLQNHCDRGQPISPTRFQRTVDEYGKECPMCFCHLDSEFQKYTQTILTMMAKEKPDFILLEDEVRQWHESRACMCPLHIERFNQDAGYSLTREEIHNAMKSDISADRLIRRKWYEIEANVLLEFAQMVRSTLDAVDPKIKAGACCETSMLPLMERFIRILAGENPPFVRLCRAPYLEFGNKDFPLRIATIATQLDFMPENFNCLSEADTWDQTQYSTSTARLKAFITATQLIGIDFPLVWPMKPISEIYDEEQPFIQMLDSNKKFFDEVTQLSKNTKWIGPTVFPTIEDMLDAPWPQSGQSRPFVYDSLRWFEYCGRMGIPATIRQKDEVIMLSGKGCRSIPDEKIQKILSGPVLLDAQSAIVLTEMGYADLLGIKATNDENMRFYFEQYCNDPTITGKYAGKIFTIGHPTGWVSRLEIINPNVQVASWLVNCRWFMDTQYEKVSPGITLFENPKGGRVAIYSNKLMDSCSWMSLALLNKARKSLLEHILTWLQGNKLPVTIDTSFDTFVLYGSHGNEDIMALFDLSTDSIKPLPVIFAKGQPTSVMLLQPDGTWSSISFTQAYGKTLLDVKFETIVPIVFRIQF